MKMKKVLEVSLCLFAMFVLGACSSDDAPVAKVPQLTGTLSFDRTRVGVGQPVKMSFSLPESFNSAVSKTEYSFNLGGAANLPVQAENNVCTFSYAFGEAGVYEISFIVRYTFSYPDEEGNIYRNDVITKELQVVACDVRNSFWGDNLEETQRNCGEVLEKLEGHENLYAAVLKSGFGASLTGGKETTVGYTFKNDKLSKVEEVNLFDTEVPFTVLRQYYKDIKNVYGETVEIGWSKDTEKNNAYAQACLNGSDKAALDALNAFLVNGNEEWASFLFKNDHTMMVVQCYKSNGKWVVKRTYKEAE